MSQRYKICEELSKLEKAFQKGGISEETYGELKAKYSARIRVLGLADSNHPAYNEVNKASAQAYEVISLYVFGGTFVTACSYEDSMCLASAIDKALENSPRDLDLITTKS